MRAGARYALMCLRGFSAATKYSKYANTILVYYPTSGEYAVVACGVSADDAGDLSAMTTLRL